MNNKTNFKKIRQKLLSEFFKNNKTNKSIILNKKEKYFQKKEKNWNNRFIYNLNNNSVNNQSIMNRTNVPFNYDEHKISNLSFNNFYNNNNNNIQNNNNDSFSLTRNSFKKSNSSINFYKLNLYKKNYIPKSTRGFDVNDIINSNNDNNNNNYLIILIPLWDELCVLNRYRELFNVILNLLNEKMKENLINKEIENLNNIKSQFNHLKNKILERKKILKILKKKNYSKKFEINFSNYDAGNINHISYLLENLRNKTIEIVLLYNNIRKEISYSSNNGKFNINLLSIKYEIDKNFLIKMKKELDFLKDGYIKYFFNFNEEKTPFFLNASINEYNNIDNEFENDINLDKFFLKKIPINIETLNDIKNCEYIIYQDLIFYQGQNLKQNFLRTISPLRKYDKSEDDIDNKKNNIKEYNLSNDNENNFEDGSKTRLFRKTFSQNHIYNLKSYKIPNLYNNEKNMFGKTSFNFSKNIKYFNENIYNNKNDNNNINLKKNIKIDNKNFNTNKIINFLNKNNKYKITFYKNSLISFNEKYYQLYYSTIPEILINFFNLKEDILSFDNDKFYIILIKNKKSNKLKGVCSISYIIENNEKIILKINHISSNSQKNYKNVIKLILSYIIYNLNYEEIIININKNIIDDLKYNELKSVFINECNFFLDNHNVFKYINENKKISEKFKNNLIKNNNCNIYNNEKIFSIFNLMILTINDINYEDFNKNIENNKVTNNINIVTFNLLSSSSSHNEDYSYSNNELKNIYDKVGNLDILLKYIMNNDIDKNELPLCLYKDYFHINSCLLNKNILDGFKLNNDCNSFKLFENGAFYNYIKNKIYTIYNKNLNINFYQIENISLKNFYLFFLEINNNNIKEFLNEDNIYIQINEIYKDCLNKNNNINNIYENKKIWIPCFEIYKHYTTNKVSFCCKNDINVDEYIKIKNNIINNNKNKDSNNINTDDNDESDCSINSFEYLPSLIIEPDYDNDIIIKTDFIIGLIYKQKEKDIPYIIFCFYINKINFIYNKTNYNNI